MKRILPVLPVVAAILLWPLCSYSHEEQPGHKQESTSQSRHHEAATKHHEAMKAAYEKAVAEMQAMDARLNEKVAAMNAASGDQKISAMEAVINELVAQRKEMHDKMTAMRNCGMGLRGQMPPCMMKGGTVTEDQRGGTAGSTPGAKAGQ